MKSLAVLAILAACSVLSSCNKKYECTCTTLDPQGQVHNVTTTEISAGSRNKAEVECKKMDYIIGNRTTHCLIN